MNKKELFIGLMSGTSLDGVDIALCKINAKECKLLHTKEYPFPLALKEQILFTISSSVTLQTIGELDHKLGKLFAESIEKFLGEFELNAKEIKAIGLHGQTLWHQPESKTSFSMQLGDANIVCAKTNIQTVADFRRMDIANAGQGAPFAPAFHKFAFAGLGAGICVVNIGGMANITLLDEPLRGWDSGCGNVLLDLWISKTQKRAYDRDGEYARGGKLNFALLNAMLADPYFQKEPPKSTGREYFNTRWLEKILSKFEPLQAQDIQRTLLELTAKSISRDIKPHNIKTIILCGGGAKNSFLVERLQELSSSNVKYSNDLGVDSDALEAMAFAWLAYKRIHREVVELKDVTGARKNSLLGAVYV
jgi:anhydro-N-acetylmuramic acid kinase